MGYWIKSLPAPSLGMQTLHLLWDSLSLIGYVNHNYALITEQTPRNLEVFPMPTLSSKYDPKGPLGGR